MFRFFFYSCLSILLLLAISILPAKAQKLTLYQNQKDDVAGLSANLLHEIFDAQQKIIKQKQVKNNAQDENSANDYILKYLHGNQAISTYDFARAAENLNSTIEILQNGISSKIKWKYALASLHAGGFENAYDVVSQLELQLHYELAYFVKIIGLYQRQQYDDLLALSSPFQQKQGLWVLLKEIILTETHAAKLQTGQQDLDAAIHYLEQTSLAQGLPSVAQLIKAQLLLRQEKYHEVIALLTPENIQDMDEDKALITMDRNGLELYLLALLGKGEHDKAVALLQERLIYSPAEERSLAFLPKLKSGVALQNFQQRSPSAFLADSLYAFTSLNLRQLGDLGLSLLRIAENLDPNNMRIQLNIISFLRDHGQTQQISSLLDAVDEISVSNISTNLIRADILIEAEAYDEAKNLLIGFSETYPSDIEFLAKLGFLYRFLNDYENAIKTYQQAIDRLNKDEVNQYVIGFLYHYMGVSYERNDNWPKAEIAFLTSLKHRPGHSDSLNYLGYSWIDQGIHIERGTKMIMQAVAQNPNDGYIVDSLGWAYYRVGKYEAAVKEMERAIQLMAGDPIVNDHLGDVYWKVERKREAKFQWQRALDFNPTPESVEVIKDKLNNGL